MRVSRGYWHPFGADLGQRDTSFVVRPCTPLKRIDESLGAFAVLPERDFDAIHALNSVPILTRRPYVLSFEDYLPRLFDNSPVRHLAPLLRRQLLHPRCVGLLAMSEFGVRQFRLQNRGVPELDALEAKMEVLRPAVALRRTEPKTHNRDELRLVFVSKRFLGKAGPALMRAHARLRQAGIPVRTTVVSSLFWESEDYVGPPSEAYAQAEHARFDQEGVVYHGALPNDEVLKLIDEADYLVLPTLADTFGYVGIEALAGGTPVIGTDTCAVPEIVEHGRSGYLLPLERDEIGRWPWLQRRSDPGYQQAYEDVIESLATSLTETLSEAWEKRGDYEAMSAGALERVRDRFDRERARARLDELYDRLRAYRFGDAVAA